MTINEKLKAQLNSLNAKVYSNQATAQDFKALVRVESKLEEVDPVLMTNLGY